MSNRRKLPSEKAARVRCPHCRGREFARKPLTASRVVLVCTRCQNVTYEPPVGERTGDRS